MFSSQYFSFPLSVHFHNCSIPIFTYYSHYIMFSSQYFSFTLSVPFQHCSIPIFTYHTHYTVFSSQQFRFPCQHHSTIAPYPSSPTTHTIQYFPPSTSVSPCQTITPFLRTHSLNYHTHYIIFPSPYFSFPVLYHSTIAPYPFINLPHTLYIIFLPVLPFHTVSTIPPLLHTHLHLPPTLYKIFLPVFQFPRVSNISPLLHTHLHLPPTLYNVSIPVF